MTLVGRPLRVLLAAHPTVGHTSALRAIGARFLERGDDVAFAIVRARLPLAERWPEPLRAASALPEAIAADGMHVVPLAASLATLVHAPRLTRKTGHDELAVALTLFTTGIEAHARTVAARARDGGAHVVVGDYLMPAAMLGPRSPECPTSRFITPRSRFPSSMRRRSAADSRRAHVGHRRGRAPRRACDGYRVARRR